MFEIPFDFRSLELAEDEISVTIPVVMTTSIVNGHKYREKITITILCSLNRIVSSC